MELRGKLSTDVDYILENSNRFSPTNAEVLMRILKRTLLELIDNKNGAFPEPGFSFLEIDNKFEVTKSYKKRYYTDKEKSEIRVRFIGKDAEETSRLKRENAERNKPKGEIDINIYSRILDTFKYPKVRVSFYTNMKVIGKFLKNQEPIKSMDFLSTLFGSNLQNYYEEMGRFPAPGEILMNPSLDIFFEIKKAYFMSPWHLEIRDGDKPEEIERKKSIKWPIGFFIQIKECDKNPDVLKSILRMNIDINLN